MALPTNWLTQGSSPFPLQRIKSNTFNLGGGGEEGEGGGGREGGTDLQDEGVEVLYELVPF